MWFDKFTANGIKYLPFVLSLLHDLIGNHFEKTKFFD